MPSLNIGNADKNIVERRRAGNAARTELAGSKGTLDGGRVNENNFRSEMLNRHARTQWRFRAAFLAIVLVGGVLAWSNLPSLIVYSWATAMAVLLTARMIAAKKFLDLESTAGVEKKWNAVFNVLQAGSGLVWGGLFAAFAFSPEVPTGAFSNSLSFAATMVLLALVLTTAHNLKFGVLISAIPFVSLVAAQLAITGTMVDIGLACILVAACVFFEHLGSTMRHSYVSHLHSAVVRDQLIVDLEAATAISDEARRRAEEANLAKSRFLATMSHELRTPLNAILGFSEVMSNEVMGPLNNDHYKEYVTDIHSSGSHLLNLINEILDLSRVEAGRYEMNEEPVSLPLAAEESQQMVKLKADQKNISIVMQLQPGLPEINADARAVRQIILNLMSNALKFTPEGGSICIKVGWTAGGGQYISIKDTGPGIPEDEIPVVLSSFGQGSIAIKSAEQGTGLGLPIVQALVHMHDGHFELKSRLREGTEVIATFPRSRVLSQNLPQNTGPVHHPSGNVGFAQNRQSVGAPPMVGVAHAENQSA